MRRLVGVVVIVALAGCHVAAPDVDEDQAPPRITLEIEAGCGTINVTSSPPALACSEDCTAEVPAGEVTLLADIDGPYLCVGSVYCDGFPNDPTSVETYDPSLTVELEPGSSTMCSVTSYQNFPEGEGEGEG